MSIPVPVHEKLVNENRLGTIPFVRFLSDLNLRANNTTIVNTVESDINVSSESQTILCDATLGDINITLPSPSASFKSKRSIKIAISRKDETANVVNILPNGTELIIGEISQFLDPLEVINIITDSENWYLGS